MDDAIKRVILLMSDRLDEPMTVDDLAKAARFSKFHFTRLFQRETGVPPGRFLSALRMEKAKRLLATTSMRVADISNRVGYSSVGTFTTRFTASVGVSPTRYRRNSGWLPCAGPGEYGSDGPGGTVLAVVRPPVAGDAGPAVVGVFPSGPPNGRSIRLVLLEQPGPHRFQGVPAGRWIVVSAFGYPAGRRSMALSDLIADAEFMGIYGPLRIEDRGFAVADVAASSVGVTEAATVEALIQSAVLSRAA